MDPETWALSCGLFECAVELPAHDRPAFLAMACDQDTDVLRLVWRMLQADASGSNAVDHLHAALEPVRSLGYNARRGT